MRAPGVDFNPQADRLRVVSHDGQNLRVNVMLGATAVDGALRYKDGDSGAGKRPRITASAYTHNVADAPDTKLFEIDDERDVLVLQDPPNDGVLTTVGPAGHRLRTARRLRHRDRRGGRDAGLRRHRGHPVCHRPDDRGRPEDRDDR